MTEDDLIKIKSLRAKKSLHYFILDFMPECDPLPFVDGKVVQFIAETFSWAVRKFLPEDVMDWWMTPEKYKEQLEELKKEYIDVTDMRQKDETYFNINIPPGHSKSIILNVMGPSWLFLNTPTRSTAISHTEELSIEMNLKRQKVLNSEKWAKYFPEVYLTKNEGRLLIGNHFGELYATNTNAFTGRSSEVIINDDLISAKQARMDKKAMKNAVDFYRDTMPSRIRDQKRGVILNVQQRLAPGDITGMILDDPDLSRLYNHVALQAISDRDRVIIMPVSGEVWYIKQGEALWPERFGDYSLLKTTQGSSVFETQYQQNPLSSSDTIVKEDDIHLMTPNEASDILENPDYTYASHDLAIKATETSSFVGSIRALQRGNILLIVDCLEKKMGYTASKNYIKNLASNFRGIIQVIEDKASGQQAIQELQGNIPGIVAFNPGLDSKIMRLDSAKGHMETKNVYFLTDEFGLLSPALQMLVDRLKKVPFVTDMDIVDAFSQLVNYVFVGKTFGMFDASFDEKNLMPIEHAAIYSKREIMISITRKGSTYKMLKVHYDYRDDVMYVLDEVVLIGVDDSTALRTLIQFAGENLIVDATNNGHLYNMFGSKANIINNTDDRQIMEQLTQLSSGFSMGKIVVSRTCVELRRDIDQVMLDPAQLKNGIMKLKSDEGLVACLRVLLYTVKGSGDFFTI